MFGIPQWALGIGFIIVVGSLASAVGHSVFGSVFGGGRRRGRLDTGKASKHDLAEAVNELQGRLDQVGDIQARLAELEDTQRRLAEVEERLDFAERMLAQQRGAERLPSPKQ